MNSRQQGRLHLCPIYVTAHNYYYRCMQTECLAGVYNMMQGTCELELMKDCWKVVKITNSRRIQRCSSRSLQLPVCQVWCSARFVKFAPKFAPKFARKVCTSHTLHASCCKRHQPPVMHYMQSPAIVHSTWYAWWVWYRWNQRQWENPEHKLFCTTGVCSLSTW